LPAVEASIGQAAACRISELTLPILNGRPVRSEPVDSWRVARPIQRGLPAAWALYPVQNPAKQEA
jgi:hypothetical protein